MGLETKFPCAYLPQLLSPDSLHSIVGADMIEFREG